jgi:putative transposase
MRTRYKAPVAGTYFVTSTIVNWIKIFSLKGFPEIIIDELNFRRGKGELKLYGYVIMPDHIHLIISSDNIPKVMRSIKSFTAKKILDRLKEKNYTSILDELKDFKPEFKSQSEYQVWQEGFHPKIILGDKEFEQKINYIHNNPVTRGFVESPNDWKYSSYNFYLGDAHLIEMDI